MSKPFHHVIEADPLSSYIQISTSGDMSNSNGKSQKTLELARLSLQPLQGLQTKDSQTKQYSTPYTLM